MRKIVIGLGIITISVVVAFGDMAWMSLEPGGSPVDYINMYPCEQVTLWAVLHNTSASASSFNFPIMYAPLVELTDYGFDYTAFEFEYLEPNSYSRRPNRCPYYLFPSHDLDNMYVTWFGYTMVYPYCDIPQGSYQSIGWVTFHMLGAGQMEIVEGLGPTGMGLLYTNGETACDYTLEFTPVLIESG